VKVVGGFVKQKTVLKARGFSRAGETPIRQVREGTTLVVP
jgi:hypothetical protein